MLFPRIELFNGGIIDHAGKFAFGYLGSIVSTRLS